MNRGSTPRPADGVAGDDEPPRRRRVPGVTACSLCAGETLGAGDPLDGGQLTRLRGLQRTGVARLTLSECLDECERGDVVVVRPAVRGRDRAARPRWFERVAGDDLTAELGEWLAAGGPGAAEVPPGLARLEIRREPRRTG